jgi:hypothetical protein
MAFYEKISKDYRLNPSHVSLYMALFQFWNLNRFENPISINRDQAMRLSKIGSNHTYHKCLHELSDFGYIAYHPSHNPLKGSLVHLCIFDTSDEQVLPKFSDKNDTSTAQALPPSLNSINNTNNKREREKNARTKKSEIVEKRKNKKKQKKIETFPPIPTTGGKNIPSALDEVLDFFKIENFPDLEARKFFNHFQSNGWKVSGKTPMKDWHAAARKWMLNDKYSNQTKPGSTNLNTNKNYDEPL